MIFVKYPIKIKFGLVIFLIIINLLYISLNLGNYLIVLIHINMLVFIIDIWQNGLKINKK